MLAISLCLSSVVQADAVKNNKESNTSSSLEQKLMSNYALEAGDKIRILVFREPDLSVETKLTDAGTIIYPFLGEINVAGSTIGELKDKITKVLANTYLIDPKVSVQIVEYREVYISGEVKNPGAFPYVPGLTVRKAIALAGWLTEFAPQNTAKLLREKDPENKAAEVNLNTPVAPGDTIIVPKYANFYVNGEVKRPGSFTYIADLNVQKAIAIAGGFTERASRAKVNLIKDKGGANKEIEVDLNAPVAPGDVVNVEESFF